MWRRTVPGDHRDVTLFLEEMRKHYAICAQILSPRSDTVQPHPKDLQHIPEKLLRGIQLTSLRICDRQQKPSQRGRLLYRNSSHEENPSYKAENEHSKTHLVCLHLAMLTAPWRNRLTPPSCHTIHQDIQIIILNVILKLCFLQKTRPSPEYWLDIGICIFIT